MPGKRLRAPSCFSASYYHLISRVVEKRMHFGDREKKRLVEDMRRHAAFGFCRVVTYCMMSNHFHILVEVPCRPTVEEITKIFPDDDSLEKHIASTLGAKAARQFIQARWLARELHNEMGLIQVREKFLKRMWDVSLFMKGFKQDFTLWFNGTREREGTLWESSFKSVLVEPGQALATVAAYIDLNPVRANIVNDPAEYEWCGYAQAMAGNPLASKGLEIVARQCGLEAEEVLKERLARLEAGVGKGSESSGPKLVPPLSETDQGSAAQGVCGLLSEVISSDAVLACYRLALYGDAITVETKEDGTPGKRGFSREEVMSVIEAGGKVPASQLVRCKVRHFADGVAVGSKSFVESVFQNFRNLFGPNRKDGGRPIRALLKEDKLFALRDLRKRVVG